MKALSTLGRIIYGGFFLYNGINHIKKHELMSAYAGAKGVPMPKLAVAGSAALLLAGGASVMLGVKPKIGAAMIATFLAGVSPMMHDFWNVEDPQQRQSEMINFSKNMALMGPALERMGREQSQRSAANREFGELERSIPRQFRFKEVA